jgi:F0F1-type ATP synthase assembly protein I
MRKHKNQEKSPLNSYVKFSALAIQMGVVIGIGALAGSWLDEKMNTSQPLATAGGALLGVIVALFLVLKELKNMS